MKMLIDAQLPARLAKYLRRRGLEVLHTSKVPPARRENRVGAPLAVTLAKGENLREGEIMNFGSTISTIPQF